MRGSEQAFNSPTAPHFSQGATTPSSVPPLGCRATTSPLHLAPLSTPSSNHFHPVRPIFLSPSVQNPVHEYKQTLPIALAAHRMHHASPNPYVSPFECPGRCPHLRPP